MSRDFDASNEEYLEGSSSGVTNLTGDVFTLSAWVNLSSTSWPMKIIAKWSDSPGTDRQYLLSVNSSGFAQCAVHRTDSPKLKVAIGTTVLSSSTWHHLLGTYDTADVKIFLDGIEEGSDTAGSDMVSTAAPLRIGAGSGGAGDEQPFDGLIGHAAIWDVYLTDDEITSLANGVSPLKIRRENLIFYAPVNGQSPELDIISGNTLSVNGVLTQAEEPPAQKEPMKAPG